MKLGVSRQIFEKKSLNIKLHKSPTTGAESFHADRRTDRMTDGLTLKHDEANSRLSQFCEIS